MTKLYDYLIKAMAGVMAMIAFFYFCAFVRYQLTLQDFLLSQGF